MSYQDENYINGWVPITPLHYDYTPPALAMYEGSVEQTDYPYVLSGGISQNNFPNLGVGLAGLGSLIGSLAGIFTSVPTPTYTPPMPKQTGEDWLVEHTNKSVANVGGRVFAAMFDTPEALKLYQIASPEYANKLQFPRQATRITVYRHWRSIKYNYQK